MRVILIESCSTCPHQRSAVCSILHQAVGEAAGYPAWTIPIECPLPQVERVEEPAAGELH